MRSLKEEGARTTETTNKVAYFVVKMKMLWKKRNKDKIVG